MHVPKDVVKQPLIVVTMISNPARYKSRYHLYQEWQAHIRNAGAILITVELATGEREHALEDHANPHEPNELDGTYQSFGPARVPISARQPLTRKFQDYIKLRCDARSQEIWLKENALNIGVRHAPADAKYFAFVDADVWFGRADFVSETLQQLQHFDVVQMWSQALDMDPHHEILAAHRSFGYNHIHGKNAGPDRARDYSHPGFAWAWRRSALDQCGGLLDRAVCGSADNHMAWALVGRGEETVPKGMSQGYVDMVSRWQANAAPLKHNVGYVSGTILHRWHGSKSKRGYTSRWKYLLDSQFDPYTDLKVDSQGLYALTGNKTELRDGLHKYFRSRNEDSIDPAIADYVLFPKEEIE